jgi:hypothetical protein
LATCWIWFYFIFLNFFWATYLNHVSKSRILFKRSNYGYENFFLTFDFNTFIFNIIFWLCIKARKGLAPQCPKVEPCGVGGRIYHNLILEMAANPFFFRQHFTKFWPKKYGFHLYKGLFMEKMTQIHQILKKKNPNCQIWKNGD